MLPAFATSWYGLSWLYWIAKNKIAESLHVESRSRCANGEIVITEYPVYNVTMGRNACDHLEDGFSLHFFEDPVIFYAIMFS